MASSDSSTSHIIEDVTTRIKGPLHQEIQDELEKQEGAKEPGSEGSEPATRVILHERTGRPTSAPLLIYDERQLLTSSTSQRWEHLRRDWAHLDQWRIRQAQAHLRLSDEALERAQTRLDLARSRRALAQQWEKLGDSRLGVRRSEDGMEEDKQALGTENGKLTRHGEALSKLEREANEDKAALEEEQIALARAWVEYSRDRDRMERVFAT